MASSLSGRWFLDLGGTLFNVLRGNTKRGLMVGSTIRWCLSREGDSERMVDTESLLSIVRPPNHMFPEVATSMTRNSWNRQSRINDVLAVGSVNQYCVSTQSSRNWRLNSWMRSRKEICILLILISFLSDYIFPWWSQDSECLLLIAKTKAKSFKWRPLTKMFKVGNLWPSSVFNEHFMISPNRQGFTNGSSILRT